jgi:ketosteroid isomerase-like protein
MRAVENRQRNIDAHHLVVEAVRAREVPEGLLAPGFSMENRLSAVTDYSYHGAVGFADWMSDLFEVFAEGARYEVEEILAAGEGYVAAMFCVTGRGARSQLPLEFRWAGVTWFRGGRATKAVGFASREEALDAVDLRP